MGRTGVLQGLREMKFGSVLERWQRHELSQTEAAEILGMSERTFRRWHGRFEAEGAPGLLDRRLGKASARRVPVDEAMRVEGLYRDRYAGFTVKHFHEHLVQHHDFHRGYTWTKGLLLQRRLVEAAPRRGAHRKKRPRRPLPGMMLHQDGSRHRWTETLDEDLDLIVTMDDATSEIYSALLVEEEGTMSSCRGIVEVIDKHGLFCSLYADRGAHYWSTRRAGGKVDKDRPTQVKRALDQLAGVPERWRSGWGHHADRCLLAASARPLGADARHAAGPFAQGAAAGRDHDGGSRQPLPGRGLSAGAQCPLRGRSRAAGLGVRHRPRPGVQGHPQHPGGAGRRQRQYRALCRVVVTAAGEPTPAALRQGQGPGPPLSGRDTGRLPRTALSRPLHGRGNSSRCRSGSGCLTPLGAREDLWRWGRSAARTGCASPKGAPRQGEMLAFAHIPTGPTTTKAVNSCAT